MAFRHWMRLRTLLAAPLLLLAPVLRASDEPWDGPPFSADPKTLIEQAERVRPRATDEGVVVLLDEASFTFDAAGRATWIERLVYRVVDEASVEDWATVAVPWSSWYQDRPTVEARVVSRDASVHMLDPKSFATEDLNDVPNRFSDMRVLRGPLPAVAPGSVVEERITFREKNALDGAGTSHRYVFGRAVEVQHARVVIDYPAAVALHLVNRTTPQIEPVRSERDGRIELVFESRGIPGSKSPEWYLPPDVSNDSYIAFSTGKSWQDVAERYAEVVDRQIGSASLATLVRTATGNATDPREVAVRILASIQKSVRYAGVEFGEGSIVPRSPAETLAHNYGDCKDKAVLLVAMLRQAGIGASVALLESGFGPDADPDLPGLGGFNHAIVVTAGPAPMWIDPTDEFARVGELPDADQDRMALIASTGTTSLVRTPVGDAAANRTVQTREFLLAEDGKSTVEETTEYYGSAERSRRRDFASIDAKERRDRLENYAKRTYLADALGTLEAADPHDLSAPFRLRIESLRAERGQTRAGVAVVAVFTVRLVQDMPWVLLVNEDNKNERAPRTKRVHDFRFPAPFSFELRYRIQPPPGYAPRPLPPSDSVALGTAKITREYVARHDGGVDATFRLDSGPRRITAAQFEELRIAIQGLGEEKPQLIVFDETGRKLQNAGDIRGAIAEFRRLSALHPNEALHHAEIAEALLAGGIGGAARKEAKRAVEIDPKSSRAHLTAGLVLSSDLLGRPFRKGFDRRGAIAEFRKAIDLDPNNAHIYDSLESVLSRNDDGQPYGDGADLTEAIDEYLRMKNDKDMNVDADVIDRDLMNLDLRTGRFADLKELTAQTKETRWKDVYALVAVGAMDGGAAALRASESIDSEKRRSVQIEAAELLAMIARRYSVASELLSAAAQGAPNASELQTRADLMKAMRKYEDVRSDPADPLSALPSLFRAIVAADPASEMDRLSAADVHQVFDDPSVRGSQAGFLREKIGGIPGGSFAPGFLVDAVLAAIHPQVDGSNDTGYRIAARGPTEAASHIALFVVREEGSWRVAAVQQVPSMLALRALRLVDAGNLVAARQWLDWARDVVVGGSGDDPLQSEPFAAVWNRGQEGDADQIRLAAAVLLPSTRRSSELALPILLAARERVAETQKWRIDQALATVYRTTAKWPELLATADRLAEKYPSSDRAFTLSLTALVSLHRFDEAERRANDRLAHTPGNPAAVRQLGVIAMLRGDYATALERCAKAVEMSQANANDYNEHAWLALFTKSDRTKAIEEARHATSVSPNSYAYLNTLAALYADEGRSAEARDALLKSLDASGAAEPQFSDWYVIGRIAENYSIDDAAIEAYEKIPKPLVAFGTVYELAQWRLAALRSHR